MVTSGLRIGTPALATRGFGATEFTEVAEIIAKDVALFLAEASHVGTPVEVSSVVGAVWADYVTAHPNTDSIELFSYLNGRTVK